MKQLSDYKWKNKKEIILWLLAVLAAATVIAAGLWSTVRRYHGLQKGYDYIDLPIVLSNEDQVVEVIRDGFTTRNRQITISFTAKGNYRDQIETLTAALVEKALQPTGDPKQGDYLKFQYGGYQVKYKNPQNERGSYDYTIRIQPTYFTTASREEAVDAKVESILEEIGVKEADYEKVKRIHDYIVDHCEYDWRNSELSHRHVKSTAYGALINGEASCQGYSVAMYRLLMEAGVDCRVITGFATSPVTGETEYHAWNLVKVNDEWYNVDVSWDDETGSYDYFLKSDETFSSHSRDPEYEADSFREEYPVSSMDWAE